jgi:hypothetical protein
MGCEHTSTLASSPFRLVAANVLVSASVVAKGPVHCKCGSCLQACSMEHRGASLTDSPKLGAWGRLPPQPTNTHPWQDQHVASGAAHHGPGVGLLKLQRVQPTQSPWRFLGLIPPRRKVCSHVPCDFGAASKDNGLGVPPLTPWSQLTGAHHLTAAQTHSRCHM